MSEICETVVVLADNEQGCMTINKSDFDANVHVLVDAEGDTDKAMTKAELHTALDEKGIEYKNSMSKAELQELHDAA